MNLEAFLPSFAEVTSKPNTLEGYGITDAVNISGAQTITGAKTFTQSIKNKSGWINVHGGLHVYHKDHFFVSAEGDKQIVFRNGNASRSARFLTQNEEGIRWCSPRPVFIGAAYDGTHRFWLGTESASDHNVQLNTSVGQILQFRDDRIIQNKIVYAPDFNITSDRRLKTNIHKIEKQLDLIEKLSGYRYDLNDQSGNFIHEQAGLIAQDVQEILPELIKEDLNGYLTISYNGIIALLVEAIKELRKEIKPKKKILGLF